jgi:uncharacterized phosphosugar-binding protein
MSPLADAYHAKTLEMLAQARERNAAGDAGTEDGREPRDGGGGMVHTFGSGHSDIIAREIVGRAGGLVCIGSIPDPTAGFIENLVGYGTVLAERYDRQYGLRPGEVVIVISNSGKNSSPLEVAHYAKRKGCVVVGLCSVAMSSTARTVHPDGRNLHAVADHVLDNGGVPGDAIMRVNDTVSSGPTSTFIGCSLLNWLMLSVMEWLNERGHPLPVLRSQNIPGAIEHNRAVGERYKHRLSKQLA